MEAEARTVEHELSAVEAAMTELNTDKDANDAFIVPQDVALRQAVGQSRLAGELPLHSIAAVCLRSNEAKLMQICFSTPHVYLRVADGAKRLGSESVDTHTLTEREREREPLSAPTELAELATVAPPQA